MEKMVLTSYLEKPYFVARKGEYVTSIQVMSRDKLEQVRGQFLSLENTIFMSHRWLPYNDNCKTSKCSNRCILVSLPVKYCDMLHQFFCIRRVYIKHLFHENLCSIAF